MCEVKQRERKEERIKEGRKEEKEKGKERNPVLISFLIPNSVLGILLFWK